MSHGYFLSPSHNQQPTVLHKSVIVWCVIASAEKHYRCHPSVDISSFYYTEIRFILCCMNDVQLLPRTRYCTEGNCHWLDYPGKVRTIGCNCCLYIYSRCNGDSYSVRSAVAETLNPIRMYQVLHLWYLKCLHACQLGDLWESIGWMRIRLPTSGYYVVTRIYLRPENLLNYS